MIGRLRRRSTATATRHGAGLVGLRVPTHAGVLSCRVLDPVDQPLPQAEVVLADSAGRRVVSGESDPFGTFVVAVPAGTYRLSVNAEGFTPYRGEVEVEEGAHRSLGDLALGPSPLPQLPPPGDWEIDPAHTTVGFVAQHIGMARVRGRFNAFTGALRIGQRMEDSSMRVAIEAASIDTNIKMRDDHLRSPDFLDVQRYPAIEFASDRFLHRGGARWTVTGALSIHGVSRTVSLDTRYLGTGYGMEGELRAACRATVELHREDFTLNWQHMLARGIAVVGSSIQIELDIQVVAAG
ncbi:YceI family protein [Streptomyces sp. MAR4 CNX-425]|uniref:YceI family protein n=1 Tax=Streptomyces sp. MAR4 CNX-425 TaxID=3406343 RepID=UPI003B50E09B